MSHASVLVALDKAKVEADGLEAALAWEMEPFDENGTCFRDGSRWDWYQVGGRYTGKFLGNDTILVKELNLQAMAIQRKENFEKFFRDAHADSRIDAMELIYGVKPDETLEQYLERECDGVVLSSYAFLSNRHWHEGERLGWFGSSTYTECERKDLDKPTSDPSAWFGKCLHKDETSGARVICWNDPSEIWQRNFYRRFIEPLPPETTLVNVDYHV